MKPQPPVAARPLVLLTAAVLGAHLLALQQSRLRQPPQPPALRALVTRVLNLPRPEAQASAAGEPRVADADAVAQAATPPVATATPGRRGAATASARGPAATAFATEASPGALPPQVAAASEAEGPAAAPLAPPAASPPAAPIDSPRVSASAPAPPAAATESRPAAASAPGAPALAYAIPGSVRLRYAVSGQSRGQTWNVNGELSWRHDGGQYEAKLGYSAPLLRSRSQQSTGRITAEGLAPLRFSDKSRSEQATHFERDSGKLVFSSNAPPADLLPGAQDRLSVFIQLAAMLAAEPAKFPPGTTISLPTAGTRDLEPWLFVVEADEMLALPGGTLATRKLVRTPRRDYDIRVELWLATGMDYVPVRIRLTQPNGDFVDQQWSSTDRP